MEKEIIVAIDFSPISVNAGQYATDLAIATGNALTLIHVVSYPPIAVDVPIPADMLDEVSITEAKTKIIALKQNLEQYSKGKIVISTTVVPGIFIDELEVLIKARDTFAVVMGIRGASAVDRWLFGSQSIEALHQLHYPVFVIPEHAHYRKIEKMALACDMHNVSDTTPLEDIRKMATIFGSSLDILYVQKSEGWDNPEILPSSTTLQKALSSLHPQFHFIKNSDVLSGISEFVDEQRIDLLIVIPKQRNFLEFLFHRSMSNKLAANINIPIVTLHR
jgi:nucleotide-binding universal stress UspA family protein